MGDEARGGELQNEVHSRLEGSSTAYGRDAQLRSMPIVQFGFERHYVVGDRFWALSGRYGTDVGSLNTSAGIGGTAYVGLVDSPLAPRTADRTYVRAKFGIDATAVLYDATLPGAPFGSDPEALHRDQMNVGRLNGMAGVEAQ